MANKILFVVNPTSEIINIKDIESLISGFAGKHKFNWQIHYTEKCNSEEKINKKIQNFLPDLIIAAGGDGTVNQVASQIIGSNIEMGIIPAGSANGLAYNLDIPSDFKEALHLALTAEAKPLDAIQLNENNYCFHLSDAGINARIVKRFESEGSKGLAGYGKQMLKELFSKRSAFSFCIDTPQKSKRYRAEMLVIANARCFGTGAVINPFGHPDDGEFEIVIIRPYPWWILFYLLRMFLFGKLEKLKYIDIIKADKASISFDKPHDMQTDGEIVKGIESLQVKIIPSALKVRYKKV